MIMQKSQIRKFRSSSTLMASVLFTQVTNIDGVLENHNDFLDRCLKDCMLTNLELLKVRRAIAKHQRVYLNFRTSNSHKEFKVVNGVFPTLNVRGVAQVYLQCCLCCIP